MAIGNVIGSNVFNILMILGITGLVCPMQMQGITIIDFVVLLLSIATVKAQEKFVFMPQWTAQAQFAGYYVALDQGFYREAGIDVDIVHPSATQSTLSRVESDEIHATTLELCQALKVVDKGVPIVNILQT